MLKEIKLWRGRKSKSEALSKAASERNRKRKGAIGFYSEKHNRKISNALKGNQNGVGKHKTSKRGVLKWIENFQSIKFQETKIEVITSKTLKTLRKFKIIPLFKQQIRIGKYLVDFCIPEWKLVVECFGTYWHSGFVKKVKDMRRKKALKKLGYKIVILWDSEINSENFNLDFLLNKIAEC